jgi:putative transposase
MPNTVVRTVKVKVHDPIATHLESLYLPALCATRRMLKRRGESSSKFYPEIPCVISKSLITKYQRNKKCKSVKRIVLPVCGDKGKQIKIVDGGIRIPAIFGKSVLPMTFPLPIEGFVRSVEFFKRDGQWFGGVCYNTPAATGRICDGVVGVDRNSVGNVAVMADPQTGTIFKLGISPAPTKRAMQGRRGNLQRAGAFRLLVKIKRKQSRRMTHENHRASKSIVDYAVKHRRAVAIEDLKGVNAEGSKIRRYSEKNNWAFAQLETFIRYKCALHGIPVIAVNPAYTSQACSRCGSIHKPDGKKFVCKTCGHNDHRDANAAFNIAQRGQVLVGALDGSNDGLSAPPLRFIDDAQTGKAVEHHA